MREENLAENFATQECLPGLQRLQNEDGGWGYVEARESRVEPTAWALLALQESSSSQVTQDSVDRGLRFLKGAQLENGSWAAVSGHTEGCWVTSLACWALHAHADYIESLLRGLRWLNEDLPADSGFVWRIVRRLSDPKKINAQNPSLNGWSWTRHTSSWVEPTAYALIVQQSRAAKPESASMLRRCKVAEAMLYDRMCAGGGWNCGNPRIYGVAGQPQIGPTVWALVALREYPQRDENRLSLDWLASEGQTNSTPESLSLAIIALRIYGRRITDFIDRLFKLYQSASFPWSVPAMSWATLAMSDSLKWLSVCRENQ